MSGANTISADLWRSPPRNDWIRILVGDASTDLAELAHTDGWIHPRSCSADRKALDMSRTRRHDKMTHARNGRDHQSCAPCWQCQTGTKPKRGARKRERSTGKQRLKQGDSDA